MADRKLRTVYVSTKKKKGYQKSTGDYNVWRGDRMFILKSLSTGKTRVYESAAAAKADGWVNTGEKVRL